MDASDANGDWKMRALFEAELAPGESLVWTGRPSLRRKLDGGTIYGIVVALVWFPLFNWYAVERIRLFDGMPLFFIVLWITIMAISVFTWLIGYAAQRLWYQRHTAYALTDRRVLALELDRGGERKRFRSEAIELVEDPRIRLLKDGSGILEFAKNRMTTKRMALLPEIIHRQARQPLAFVEIEDGQAVFQQFLMARDRIVGTGGQPG